jgi:hypothetical protein
MTLNWKEQRNLRAFGAFGSLLPVRTAASQLQPTPRNPAHDFQAYPAQFVPADAAKVMKSAHCLIVFLTPVIVPFGFCHRSIDNPSGPVIRFGCVAQ